MNPIQELQTRIEELEQKEKSIKNKQNYASTRNVKSKKIAAATAMSRFNSEKKPELESLRKEKARIMEGGAHCSYAVSCDFLRSKAQCSIDQTIMEEMVRSIMNENEDQDLTFEEAEKEAAMTLFKIQNS